MTMTNYKQHIKKLSYAIDRLLNDNAEANYYNGLVDAGEWSQSDPDFNKLIVGWKLTPRLLMFYIEQADYWASTWYLKYPLRHIKKARPWDSDISYLNVWRHILDNLETLRYFYR